MKVLVTGGAGYIGSTVCAALEDAGHRPVILDSLVTGAEAFTRGRVFYRGDIADGPLLRRIFAEHPDLGATLHFAARIVVPESVAQPGLYYRENVCGSLALFQDLRDLGQSRLIYSSSASIYSAQAGPVVREDSPLAPQSPYARSKWMTEQMLSDLCAASQTEAGRPSLRALALRYFNPIGADPALRSGPHVRAPSHVLGQLLRAARGEQPAFELTGTDYATRDGTGLRDYVHVWDLAQAHVAALERFDDALSGVDGGFLPVNIGTGNGVTVAELVAAFRDVWPGPLEVRAAPRRPGDSAGAYADISLARERLGWTPRLSTRQALESALAWLEIRDERLR